jgi:hypothetical protein
MIAQKRSAQASIAPKASHASLRSKRLEALEKVANLQCFISLANAIPFALPDLGKEQTYRVIASIQAGRLNPDDSASVERFRQERIGRLAEIARQFTGTAWQAYINSECFDWRLYDALRLIRQTLDELAQVLRAQRRLPEAGAVNVATLHRPPMPNEEIWLDGQGRLEIREPPWPSVEFYRLFSDTLAGIDATRIRRCMQCPNLFWAKRQDQWTCSRACAGRRRFMKFYQTNPTRHRARQLKAQGYSRAAIAERLGVDIAKIRQWTKSRREKQR